MPTIVLWGLALLICLGGALVIWRAWSAPRMTGVVVGMMFVTASAFMLLVAFRASAGKIEEQSGLRLGDSALPQVSAPARPAR